MEKRTHIACANMLSLSIIRPQSINALLLTTSVATLAGILPDIDLKDSTSDKIFDRLMSVLITIIIMTLLLKAMTGLNIISELKKYNNILNYLITFSIFTLTAYLGSKTKHRSFTHSILAATIYGIILSYSVSNSILKTFIISYTSHILLDILNMKGVSLLYPIKKKYSIKLCESSGTFNNILLKIFSIIIIIELITL